MFGHTRFGCMNMILLAAIGITLFSYISEMRFLSSSSHTLMNTSYHFPITTKQNTPYHSSSAEKQNITTIVIAYFPLSKSKHTEAEYLSWLENLLGFCRSPIVIYTSAQHQSILHRLRRNGTLTTHFVVDYASPLEIPPIKPLVPTFERQYGTDSERAHHSVELYALWCGKAFLLNRTVELNPFRTKYFVYIDAGALRSPDYRFQWWPHGPNVDLILGKDRLLLGMIFPLPRLFCLLSFNRLSTGPIRMNLIEGGIIGGSAQAIHWWTMIFYGTINSYLPKNFFIGKDQYLMNTIALTYPRRINIMLSFRVPCGNIWFNFLPLLANQVERQNLSFSSTCQDQNLSDVVIPLENICHDKRNLV